MKNDFPPKYIKGYKDVKSNKILKIIKTFI